MKRPTLGTEKREINIQSWFNLILEQSKKKNWFKRYLLFLGVLALTVMNIFWQTGLMFLGTIRGFSM